MEGATGAGRVLARVARPAVALLLLLVALAAWGLLMRSWLRALPVRRHLERGMEAARQGLGVEAERAWRQALAADPKCKQAYQLLGEYYLTSQRWSRAAEALRKLRDLAPAEPHVSCRLASALLSAHDEVGAYRESEAELRRDPDCVPALAVAAVMLNQVGEQQRRLTYLRRLGRLQPDDPDIQYMLGDALTTSYAYAEARPVLEHVLRMAPEYPEALTLLGIGWLNERGSPERLARAESYLTRALALQPLDPRARLELGRVSLERGKASAAVAQLEEASRLQPGNYRVAFELARAYEAAGRREQARVARGRFGALRQMATEKTVLMKRCAGDPGSFDNHYRLGLLLMRMGDYPLAYHYLRRARDLRPQHPPVAAALRSLAALTGLPARADAVVARAATANRPATAPAGSTP